MPPPTLSVTANADKFFLPDNNTLNLADLFTVSGGSALKYRFYDTNATAGSGNLVVGGDTQNPRTVIEVDAANLSSVTYNIGLANGGRDDILVQVWDGTQWTSPVNLAIINDHLTVGTDGSIHVARGANISGTEFVGALTFTDIDGNAPVAYRLTDTDASVGSGYFTLGGVVINANTPVTVYASQVSLLQWHASTSNTAETVKFEVFDGFGYGASANYTFFTDKANTPPVVTGSVQRNHAAGDHISAASLIASYFDADGHAAVSYRFYDTNADVNSGSFYLDGNLVAARTVIELKASELNRLEFRSSLQTTGTASRDDIQIYGYDGYNYSVTPGNAVVQTTHV